MADIRADRPSATIERPRQVARAPSRSRRVSLGAGAPQHPQDGGDHLWRRQVRENVVADVVGHERPRITLGLDSADDSRGEAGGPPAKLTNPAGDAATIS